MRFASDARLVVRQLRRSPGFVLVAVLTLALGIGANLAVFSLVQSTLIHPAGIPNAEGVVAVRAHYSFGDLKSISISAPDFGDITSAPQVFSSAAVLKLSGMNYERPGANPERLTVASASHDWFNVFGVSPALGRVFTPEEDVPGAEHEAVLTDKTWRERFGADPGVLGRSVVLNQQSYSIIGVLGPQMAYPKRADLFIPLALPPALIHEPQKNRYNENLFSVARPASGVSVERANSFLQQQVQQQIRREGANSYGQVSGWGMFCLPLKSFLLGDQRKPMMVLLAAVALVLFIACANIAGLQLARASARQHELAIRIALGARARNIVAQSLLESSLLTVVGVALGFIVAHFLVPLFALFMPDQLRYFASFASRDMLQPALLAFVTGAAVLTTLLCGVAPAWHALRIGDSSQLQESGRSETTSRTRQRLRSSLVTTEIAVAMLLLLGSGLLIRSLASLEKVTTGFDPENTLTARVSLPATAYADTPKQAAFFTGLESQLSATAGASSVALAESIPFTDSGGSASFNIIGRTLAPNDPGPHGAVRGISPGYFSTMRIPLLAGRFFTAEDRAGTEHVAIVDKTLADRYWPGQNPIGQHISVGGGGVTATNPAVTIVGLVAHARSSSLENDLTEGTYYLPLSQEGANSAYILARVAQGNPIRLRTAIESAVRDIDPSLPIYDVATMDERVDDSLSSRRFLVRLLTAFASLALLLAAVGLYGIIHYTVTLRTRELGIRLALGAPQSQLIRLILSQGMQLAGIGLLFGILGAAALSRVYRGMLYQVSALNPLTIAATSLLLLATVLVASFIPARRVTRLDPAQTLRKE